MANHTITQNKSATEGAGKHSESPANHGAMEYFNDGFGYYYQHLPKISSEN